MRLPRSIVSLLDVNFLQHTGYYPYSKPWRDTVGENFSTVYGYDAIGRPRFLKRIGVISIDGTVESFGLLDGLTYDYEGALPSSISRETGAREFYGQPGAKGTILGYNSAGQLITDTGRQLKRALYNNNGLPREIEVGTTRLMSPSKVEQRVYSSDGKLISVSDFLKTSRATELSGKRTYLANFTFASGSSGIDTLMRVDFPGGYFDNAGVHWMLTDALGSVELVVDSYGRVEQHTGYYPYGEPWREPAGQPYLFGGKERRRFASLGDSDFHARFLTTSTALWQAPDVHAGKYPWLSPWVFCAANPIRYRDPSGKRIEIDKNLGLKEIFTILLNLQKLTDDQLVYKTEGDGSKHVKIASLGKGSHTYGTRLIRKLNSHKKTVTIDYKNSSGSIRPQKDKDPYNGNYCVAINAFEAENGPGSDSRITFDPDSKSQYGERPAYIGLAHELIHASHNADGTAYYMDTDGDGVTYEEERTVGIGHSEGDEPTENHIRKEHGVPARPKY